MAALFLEAAYLPYVMAYLKYAEFSYCEALIECIEALNDYSRGAGKSQSRHLTPMISLNHVSRARLAHRDRGSSHGASRRVDPTRARYSLGSSLAIVAVYQAAPCDDHSQTYRLILSAPSRPKRCLAARSCLAIMGHLRQGVSGARGALSQGGVIRCGRRPRRLGGGCSTRKSPPPPPGSQTAGC